MMIKRSPSPNPMAKTLSMKNANLAFIPRDLDLEEKMVEPTILVIRIGGGAGDYLSKVVGKVSSRRFFFLC